MKADRDLRPPVDPRANSLDEEDRPPDTFRPSTIPAPPPSLPAKHVGSGVRTAAAFFLGAAAGLLAPPAVKMVERVMHARMLLPATSGIVTPAIGPLEPAVRADAKLDRKGRSPIAGGLMVIPPAFESANGAYDLVLHFHGNTDLVEDSFGVASINAPVVIFNFGTGSGPYEERFSSPDLFKEVLSRVDMVLEKRGLKNPQRRRIALSAWSAGYGAVVRILENPALAEMVDAVILLDGIHAAFLQNGRDVDPLRIAPYEKLARQAIAGEKLFVITHSNVEPYTYASARATTDAVLAAVGLARKPGGTEPEMPALSGLHGIPKAKVMAMVPDSELHVGSLHVRAYRGDTPEHHMMHLLHMATIALPELAARWSAR